MHYHIMNPRLILALFLLTLASFAFAQTKPNIILINADDLGYGDVGCYGATKVRTPNIDRLAGEGRMFTDAHSASAVCSPSRYALLTGEYPIRKKLYPPIMLRGGLAIDIGQETIASLLKVRGYATACIGKWHLGFGDKEPDWNGELRPGPLELGFDHYFGVPVVNSHPRRQRILGCGEFPGWCLHRDPDGHWRHSRKPNRHGRPWGRIHNRGCCHKQHAVLLARCGNSRARLGDAAWPGRPDAHAAPQAHMLSDLATRCAACNRRDLDPVS